MRKCINLTFQPRALRRCFETDLDLSERLITAKTWGWDAVCIRGPNGDGNGWQEGELGLFWHNRDQLRAMGFRVLAYEQLHQDKQLESNADVNGIHWLNWGVGSIVDILCDRIRLLGVDEVVSDNQQQRLGTDPRVIQRAIERFNENGKVCVSVNYWADLTHHPKWTGFHLDAGCFRYASRAKLEWRTGNRPGCLRQFIENNLPVVGKPLDRLRFAVEMCAAVVESGATPLLWIDEPDVSPKSLNLTQSIGAIPWVNVRPDEPDWRRLKGVTRDARLMQNGVNFDWTLRDRVDYPTWLKYCTEVLRDFCKSPNSFLIVN